MIFEISQNYQLIQPDIFSFSMPSGDETCHRMIETPIEDMKGYIRTIRLILRHSFPIFKHWDEYLASSCSFVLSFSNLRSSAVQAGFDPLLAWCWPICIDALLISGSLMVLRGSVQGLSTLLGWGVLASYTAISTGFNIAHSPGVCIRLPMQSRPFRFVSVWKY